MATQPLEFLEERGLDYYPFLTQYSAKPELNQLFADLYIATNQTDTISPDLYLDQLVLHDIDDFDLMIKQADGSTVFDSTSLGVNKKVGSLSSDSKWLSTEYADTVTGTCVKFIINRAVYVASFVDATTYSSMGLGIVNRNVECRALRVNSIQNLTDALSISAGYNVALTKVDDSAIDPTYRNRTQIKIDIVPGYGLGKYNPDDCNNPTTELKTLNGIGPDIYGNFIMYPNSCYWYDLVPASNELVIHNDCVACFDCHDIVSAYDSLRDIYMDGIALRVSLSYAIDKYNEYLDQVSQLQAFLQQTIVTPRITQTDYQAFDLVFRLQTGAKAIKKVTIAVGYDPIEVTAILQPYSGYYKLPSFAAQSLSLAFDGTSAIYDATADPDNTKLKAGTYAYWYWNMHFERSDALTAVNILYTVTVEFVDGSANYVLGPDTETVNITPVP